MKDFDELKLRITTSAGLGRSESTGFHSIACHVCNNSRKTGGWKFEHDKIVYHCFRASCGTSSVYEYGNPIPRRMRDIFRIIGVDVPPSLLMVKSSFQKELENLDDRLYTKPRNKPVHMPAGTIEYDLYSGPHKAFWDEFMARRMLPPDDFIIADGGQYRGCLGVKLRGLGGIYGYQFITKNGLYLKHFEGNENILYVPSGRINNTVVLVEGTLDAKCFPNTVATLSSKVAPEQAYLLRGKRVIMLPDRTGNGMIDQFHEYGWSISLPDWDANDLNEAVQKYGVIYSAKMIMNNLYEDKLKATTAYRLWRI